MTDLIQEVERLSKLCEAKDAQLMAELLGTIQREAKLSMELQAAKAQTAELLSERQELVSLDRFNREVIKKQDAKIKSYEYQIPELKMELDCAKNRVCEEIIAANAQIAMKDEALHFIYSTLQKEFGRWNKLTEPLPYLSAIYNKTQSVLSATSESKNGG